MAETKFRGYNPTLQFMKTDKSFRVIIDVSLDEYNNIKDIPLLPEGVYEVELKQEVIEE